MKRRMLSFVLAASMLLLSLSTLSGCSKKEADTFTMWVSPNSALLEEYQDLTLNPVMQYVSYKFGINLQFQVPASGSEAEQFTVLTTDPNCPDIMDLSYYSGGAYDLVQDGVALDLTEYIYPTDGGTSYFPNYASVLDSQPDVKNTIRTTDNHFYTLYTIDDEQRTPWGGYMYRRDLVLKYADASDSFTLDGKTVDPSAWTAVDDVVFPSGAKAPDLISDWDWMFNILQRAVEAGELNYCMSLFYPGFVETGDMISAWGVAGFWYKEVENGQTTVKFGANTDGFKSYLEKMHEWWEKGYIDKDFSSRTNDMFFAIDAASYARGRIGCFYGTDTLLGDSLKGYDGVDDNIDLRACYMPRAGRDSEPISYYAGSQVNRSLMITTKVLDKDYGKLFAALDYLYSEEGALMTRLGLNQAQYAELKTAGFTDFWDAEIELTPEEMQLAGVSSATQKLSDVGTYHFDDAAGKYVFWKDIETEESGYEMCASGMNFWGMCAVSKFQYLEMSDAVREALYEVWSCYDNIGFIDLTILPTKLSSADNYDYIINYNALNDYMRMEAPKFIKGVYSLEGGKDWETFCDNLVLKGCNKNTGYLQSVYNQMEGR